MNYTEAIKALNDAALVAIKAGFDTTKLPCIDRQALRLIARETDRLVSQDKQSGEHPSHIAAAV